MHEVRLSYEKIEEEYKFFYDVANLLCWEKFQELEEEIIITAR